MSADVPPERPDPHGAPRHAGEPQPGPADAEPYDAGSESGPVYESGGTADRTWQTACHLVTLTWLLGLAVVHLLAPLGLWYFFRREDPDVERHAKEAFNFQVNMLLWEIVGGILLLTCFLAPAGLVLIVGGAVLSAVLPVVAAVKTSDGADFRYPATYRFLD